MPKTDRRDQSTPTGMIHPSNFKVMETKLNQLINALTQQ
jgi:hypothetical protein